MTTFHEFLRGRLEAGGFTTEDTLASVLPLMREVLEAHAADMVAPLEGLDALHVEGVKLWFEDAQRRPVRRNPAAVSRVSAVSPAAVEVIAEARRTTAIDVGEEDLVDLAIGDRDDEVRAPVYLPGYVAWEHQLEHHDPLTDVFSLGMILASLACGLDFTEPDDLRTFVAHRNNLFALNRGLHPVLARAIVRMTELDRHRRAQDLGPMIRNLENYREQEVDFDFDLASTAEFADRDVRTRQHVVLRKLRERLFEISRRNRLLHFRPTMQTVNLTHASVPLSFDVRSIRPDQILVWNDDLHESVVQGHTISLNRYLNFAEALYLPSVLDRIAAEARRDQAEFGFAQLRLAVCFLHWANLKEQPAEAFRSPLVLLPVRLKKKKGIRDTYLLEPLSSEAEINPVIRHLFKELYDIHLPETVDLATTKLDKLYEHLLHKIQSSEPAVTLSKVDRPRIALIHEKARRRLDQYRRRARLAGRGVRSFLDLDYSYDPANYHPLGITLFSTRIRPPATHLREIIEEKPRPRTFAGPHPGPPAVEKERTFYSLDVGGDDNPYSWSFDLCSVTLANFKYRKMSLVRDYEALLVEQPTNDAFEATFSLVPRPAQRDLPATRSLDDRYDVVPCDPTQATAIEEAHAGRSYIIQGPPGTGKSQTITNLIADFVARGKRVLFVCEKRAAIDVVYARLRQCGLSELCCLIHDSQTDKREFVMDLRQTYETALADAENGRKRRGRGRSRVLRRLKDELEPLEQFDDAMERVTPGAGIPVRQLLSRCVELRHRLPELTPLEKERLPDYATWWQNRERIAEFDDCVREFQRDGVLARHPLAILSPRLAHAERPLATITMAVEQAQGQFERIEQTLGRTGIPRQQWQMPDRARQLVDYVERVLPVAKAGQMALLDSSSERAGAFTGQVASMERLRSALDQAREANRYWRQKLPAAEVPLALEQARVFERQLLPWMRLGWWRLRKVLRRSYNFKAHLVRPGWTQILSALETEYGLAEQFDHERQAMATEYGIAGDADEFVRHVAGAREMLPNLPDWLAGIHGALLKSDNAGEIAERAAQADGPLVSLALALAPIADGWQDRPIDRLRGDLERMVAALDDLPDFLRAMEEIAGLPDSLSECLRKPPLAVPAVEAAVADASLEAVYRGDRALQRFDGRARNRHVRRLELLYDEWLQTNAAEIRHRARQRFLENVHLAGRPASQLDAGEKEFKKRYNRGRRELEHEFGKSMRYKSIRDLVSGDSGEVVKDLKPVWLMSPLSVSDTLPLDSEYFDVVIFDEASQVPLEEAVPPVFRAGQAIVVGDEMQLPPTDFFSAKRSDEEEELLVEEAGELVQYDLGSNSFLNHAAKNLPSTMLGWHYRSRSESLVSFSNWTFYDGRLLTVPEEQLPAAGRRPLRATQPEDGEAGAAEVLQRAISFHFMEHGVYDSRRNRAEAEYIAHMVRALVQRPERLSIGIVAFSEAQQDEIEGALERLAQQDRRFRDLLEAETEREVDGQFVGLLVKNLENIQGDERDIVILSICYGRPPDGKMRMNFGPINKSGGEKRLNVAFSRAKHHMAVVSSIHDADITNDYNDGANCLKSYLRYAEAVSISDGEAARRVLHGMSRWHEGPESADDPAADAAIEQIAGVLTERGLAVDRAIGQSHFRCDLAARRPGDDAYRLGILVDTESYYDQPDILERDMMRPRLLRAFGWKVAFVLAKDWYEDPEEITAALLRLADGEDDVGEEQASGLQDDDP